ncbi:MAG TPA: site-2 protease family protein [Candidatus Acidoferrum sp.]|nr:site-2 protease family protein [Candidatus Acidoferrum sp.]
MDYYILALVILSVYWLFVLLLNSVGILERHNITTYGPILMIRTVRGQQFLDRLARPKKIWNAFADIGIFVVVLSMIFMFILLILNDYLTLQIKPGPTAFNEPRNILLLPGINQFIPLTWGIIALIVALIVHELSHAILSRAADIKLKAMGLLVLVLPVGAFAEPDELQILGEEAKENGKIVTRRERLRVNTAGIMGNFIVAIICLALFFGPVLSAITPTPGLGVVGVVSGSSADKAGIRPGMTILQIDNTIIASNDQFHAFMNTTHPGQVVEVKAAEKGTTYEFTVTLSKNPNFNQGFLGVTGGSEETLNFLKQIPYTLNTVGGWVALLGLALVIFNGFTGDVINLYQPIGWASHLGPGIFWIANTLLWVGWLNFYAGLFNSLPTVPLDGGNVFRDIFKSIIERLSKNVKFQDLVTRVVADMLGVIILASFILIIIGPRIFSVI